MGNGKAKPGNFFEDFAAGQVLAHATPRTISDGDVALYIALTGALRAALLGRVRALASVTSAPSTICSCSTPCSARRSPDVSLNAVANLGYAELPLPVAGVPGRHAAPVSEVIGKSENANEDSGIVYVRTTGRNQRGEPVLEYARWVMVHKRDASKPTDRPCDKPDAERAVRPSDSSCPRARTSPRYECWPLAGSPSSGTTKSASASTTSTA